MRLIGQEVDALAEHQLNEFAGERLLTGLALKCRSRPTAAVQQPPRGILINRMPIALMHQLQSQAG